jgi:hypothetical protein
MDNDGCTEETQMNVSASSQMKVSITTNTAHPLPPHPAELMTTTTLRTNELQSNLPSIEGTHDISRRLLIEDETTQRTTITRCEEHYCSRLDLLANRRYQSFCEETPPPVFQTNKQKRMMKLYSSSEKGGKETAQDASPQQKQVFILDVSFIFHDETQERMHCDQSESSSFKSIRIAWQHQCEALQKNRAIRQRVQHRLKVNSACRIQIAYRAHLFRLMQSILFELREELELLLKEERLIRNQILYSAHSEWALLSASFGQSLRAVGPRIRSVPRKCSNIINVSNKDINWTCVEYGDHSASATTTESRSNAVVSSSTEPTIVVVDPLVASASLVHTATNRVSSKPKPSKDRVCASAVLDDAAPSQAVSTTTTKRLFQPDHTTVDDNSNSPTPLLIVGRHSTTCATTTAVPVSSHAAASSFVMPTPLVQQSLEDIDESDPSDLDSELSSLSGSRPVTPFLFNRFSTYPPPRTSRDNITDAALYERLRMDLKIPSPSESACKPKLRPLRSLTFCTLSPNRPPKGSLSRPHSDLGIISHLKHKPPTKPNILNPMIEPSYEPPLAVNSKCFLHKI